MLIFDIFTSQQYADSRKEYKHWEYAEKGFFCAKPHIHLESFYIYEEQNTFCDQHIIIENAVKCINIWEHTFAKSELEQDLKDAGFTPLSLYGNIAGVEYGDDRKEMCIVAQK